jgi:hypothetical protein
VLAVLPNPGAHPPISLYDGTLDHATPSGVRQEVVALRVLDL